MSVELTVDIFPSVAHELAVELMAFAAPRHVRLPGNPEAHRLLASAGLAGETGAHLWSGVVGLTYARRWAGSDQLLEGLAAADPEEIRAAADELAPGALDALGPGLPALLAEVAATWRSRRGGLSEERLAQLLAADAALRRGQASRLAPAALVEAATNGVVWTDQPGVETLALMPTYALRPWTHWQRAGSAMVVSHPVADESLGGNGDLATARAVRLARVLSDESRVRAIRLLAAEPATLQELAGRLGLRKSTVHHHLAELRAAGLLRVPFGSKRYSLRTEALDAFASLVVEIGRPVPAGR